jgi:hypothetical protein
MILSSSRSFCRGVSGPALVHTPGAAVMAENILLFFRNLSKAAGGIDGRGGFQYNFITMFRPWEEENQYG